jgi:SpoVK/Ycf46/Vps4 family AAA+-type ATPase
MLRKGRFDETFFVDLPNPTEREAIWKLVIGKNRRDPVDFDIVQLSRITEGLTGSEIEALFLESLFAAFERGAEPCDLDIATALHEFVPLSRMMAEQMEGLRQWAKGRARTATLAPSSSLGSRKMVV